MGEGREVGSAEDGISGPTLHPSNMKTMSAIDGLSSGSGAVQRSPTFTPNKNSSHSDDSGSNSSSPGSSNSEICPFCNCYFTHLTMSSSWVNITGFLPVRISNSTIPKLYTSASLAG